MLERFMKLFSKQTQKQNADTLQERNTSTQKERISRIVATYSNKISHSGGLHYIENIVRDCLNEIAKSEGHSCTYKDFNDWKLYASPDYRNAANDLYEMFNDKYRRLQIALDNEKRQKEQAEIELKGRRLFEKNKDMINRFFEIAYRKVTTVDEYGDENWKALEKELLVVIHKIAEKEGYSSHMKSIKSGYYWKVQELEYLNKQIRQEFRSFYDREKSAPVRNNGIEEMSGREFENYLMNIFRRFGYDVSGTPTTGDQGADMIVTMSGKRVAIQAKKYSSSVGNKAIQEVVSARTFYNCDEAWVVTNSSFTKSAKDLAQKCNVKILDGHEFNRWVESSFSSKNIRIK